MKYIMLLATLMVFIGTGCADTPDSYHAVEKDDMSQFELGGVGTLTSGTDEFNLSKQPASTLVVTEVPLSSAVPTPIPATETPIPTPTMSFVPTSVYGPDASVGLDHCVSNYAIAHNSAPHYPPGMCPQGSLEQGDQSYCTLEGKWVSRKGADTSTCTVGSPSFAWPQ